jgi:hypothetical protein
MQSVQGTGPIFVAFKNGHPGNNNNNNTSMQSTLMGGTVQETPIEAAILLNNDNGMPELKDRASAGVEDTAAG